MPETNEVRERILKWKDENNVSYQQLAVMVGKSKQEVYDAITGRNTAPGANQLILKIIQMFGLN